MIITVTETGSFMRCRRRWDYSSRNRQGLEPVINAPALTLGSLMHLVLEKWTLGEIPDDDLDSFYMTAAADKVAEIISDYKRRIGVKPNMDELGDVYEAIEIGRSMVANYKAYYKTPLPKGYKTIQPEQTCLVPIPGTDGGFLEGTLDSLVQNSKGVLFVLERKTYKQRPRKDRLARNHQFLAYYWILRQLFPDRTIGGILYDGMWKKVAPGKKQTLDDLFFRNLFTRAEEEVEEFSANIVDIYNDMANDPKIYPYIPWQGCWDCRFDKLCEAQSLGEDVEYVRETYYKQREPDSRFEMEDRHDDNSE